MSNFFKPKDFKDFKDAPAPVELPDGTYKSVLTDEDLKICSRRMCLMDTAPFSYTTQNSPSCAFASYYALRKIYGNDEDAFNTALLNQFDCVFNATPPVCGLLLGAGLALEDRGHLKGISAENDLKIGLMGPLSGIGDVFIWILPMTILGSIAGYMAKEGSPVGILLWFSIWMVIYFWRMQNYVQGFKAGAAAVTKLGDKLSVLTDSASILGLTVVGSLFYSSVKIVTPLVFTYGEVTLGIQEKVLDAIFPNLLGVIVAFVVYKLIKKGVKFNLIIFGIIIASCICSALGILAA